MNGFTIIKKKEMFILLTIQSIYPLVVYIQENSDLLTGSPLVTHPPSYNLPCNHPVTDTILETPKLTCVGASQNTIILLLKRSTRTRRSPASYQAVPRISRSDCEKLFPRSYLGTFPRS